MFIIAHPDFYFIN